MELGLLLEMAAGNDPDRVAVTDARGSLTLGELHAAARRAASRFDRAGVRQVGYLGTNGLALPVALFGAALAGRPFVPLNYRWSDAQLAQVIGDGDGLTVVVSADEADRLRSIDQRELIDSADLLSDRSDADVALPAVDAEGIAVLLYTSGTTSAPKAAILRHRHLSAYIIGTVEFGSAATDDAVLVSVPPYHIAGISSVLSNLYSGRRIVYLDPFEPGRWLALVRDEGVTHAMVVPTMLARIVDELGDEHADVPTLQSLAYGGALMPLPVIERALQRFPDVRFTNAYGLTETSSTITLLGPEDHRAAIASDDPEVRARLRSAGRPLPGVELLVTDPEGRACPPGVVGEVLVRGEQVSGEYVGGDTDPTGWFPTRDRGSLDGEGFLFIEGRSDDTIIRGGENIAPAEIEEALLRHPAVKDCAVVGLPDPEWGQRIAAAVTLAGGATTTPAELRDWVRERLRGSKTPELIVVRDELPYTPTGKLLRREVRASLTEEPGEG